MFKDLRCFVRERFSLKITVPLTIILFGAPASLVQLRTIEVVTGGLSTFLALLILRIADDISDISTDAVTSSERGLVCGRIRINKLKYAAFFCGVLILVCNYSWPTLFTVTAVTVFYFIFYFVKKNIPYMLHPFFVNVIFPIIPIYAGVLSGHRIAPSLVLFALFIWTAVIAHDFAHSVHGPEEGRTGIQSFSKSMGSKASAMLSSGLFLCSAVLGFLFWYRSNVNLLFPIALTCTSAQIAYQCRDLLRNPVRSTAKKFYISGFLFFLVPSAVIFFDGMLKTIGIR